ncbi:MAG TPA: DUF2330 domain-containing protein [Phycisphaerae bacterium]|nr:DUF2330 domain-containing protein [Phycisphaerae bacterium]
MKLQRWISGLMLVYGLAASVALGDGGYFEPATVGNLAQTVQKAVIAFHVDAEQGDTLATYVLQSAYEGSAEEFAWVIPVPGTPTNVIAHENDDLLAHLERITAPRLTFVQPYDYSTPSGGGGCFCNAVPGVHIEGGGDMLGEDNQGVAIEDRGQAGIFEWVALTSTGSDDLLTWLDENGFAVPEEAEAILNGYIEEDWHFLALRVAEPEESQDSFDEVDIPAIQFTCQTTERVYPMAISQVSAAEEAEVLVYVLAEHRAEAANLGNGVVDRDRVIYDPDGESKTNYEELLVEIVTENDGLALITEYAEGVPGGRDYVPWPEGTDPGVIALPFLTRMRTVIARSDMTIDFEFEDAPEDEAVYENFYITMKRSPDVAGVAGPPLVGVLVFGAFGHWAKRWLRKRR